MKGNSFVSEMNDIKNQIVYNWIMKITITTTMTKY